MAEFTNEGMQEFIDLCIFTDRQLERVIGRSIYPGGKLVANAVKKAIDGIHTDDHLFKFAAEHDRMRAGPTKREKAWIAKSFGIAEIRRNVHGWNVKLGFDGYSDIRTTNPRIKMGVLPNALIARSVNSGTSFMAAQPFMDITVRQNTKACEKVIEEQFDKEIAKIWERYK